MSQNQSRHRAGDPGGVGGRFRSRGFAPPDPSVELTTDETDSPEMEESDLSRGLDATDVDQMLENLHPSQPVEVRRRTATAAEVYDDLGQEAARDRDVLVRANALWSPGLEADTRRQLESDPELGRLMKVLTT